MCPVYGDKCFLGGDEEMLGGQKFASDTEVQSVIRHSSGLDSSQRRSLHRAFRSLLALGTMDKYLNERGQYVENETLMFNI